VKNALTWRCWILSPVDRAFLGGSAENHQYSGLAVAKVLAVTFGPAGR
jgi:hypothetical protein